MERARSLFLSCSVIACLAVASTTGAGAQQLLHPGLSALTPVGELLVNFDENGNATMALNGGPPTPLTGSLMPDPACSGCAPALTYLLPETVISGDVAIVDPPSQGGGVSDWLRFTDEFGTLDGSPTGDGSRMIYYSLFVPDNPSDNALADVPFPANIGSQNSLNPGPTEVVSDGTSSFDYQPGGVPYPQDNEYIGVSDQVTVPIPEPASLGLLAAYLAAMGIIVRRRSAAPTGARPTDKPSS